MSIAYDPVAILDTLRPPRDAVRRRLASVRRRVRGRLLLDGLAWTACTVFLFAATSLTADWLLRFSLPVRVSLAALAAAAILAVAWRRLARPLGLKLDDLDLAAVLDRRVPGVGQRVAAVLQLPGLLEGRALASPSMVRAAVLEHAGVLDRTDLNHAFDPRALRRALALLLVTTATAGAFVYLRPETAALWARRWLAGSHERWPQRTYLALVGLGDDGKLLVAHGESLSLEIDAFPSFSGGAGRWTLGGRGETLVIPGERPPVGGLPDRITIHYQAANGAARQGSFSQFHDGRYRYEVPQVVEPLAMSIAGGDDWFGPIHIEPIDRPGIKSLSITARRGGAGESETVTYDGADSQLLFLSDTRLELKFTASAPLLGAELLAKPGEPPKLNRVDDRHYTASWTMTEAQTLEFRLVGRRGGLASKPYFVTIGLLTDRAPRVAVRSSGVGRRVTPQARIPLAVHAADDFGLTKLDIELEQTVPKEGKPEVTTRKIAVELPLADEAAPLPEFDVQREVALAEYGFIPGTLVKLRGTGRDRCAQGVQTGSSRWLSFQVVTPEELFYEILMRQRAERAKFAVALETARSQTEILAGPLDDERAFSVVRKQQLVARQVWQVANRLDATLQEMTLNELGSEQARDLLKTKVIDAIRELHTDAMTHLRDALQAVARDPAGATEQLVEARELHQEVVDQMRRILEQMSQWENFIDVLNQLKEIVKLQNGVLETTEEEKKTRTREIFDD
ncbi:MAG TPA: hypothetical protein VMV69_05995 [Pirellulales bacterium]|nr:hypothetical protein [Pirellulales bacterium]